MDFKTKRLIRRLERQVKKLGGELEVDIIDTKHQNNLWYGGDIAEIKYKNHRLVIAAVGDVKVEVADENDNYVGYVKENAIIKTENKAVRNSLVLMIVATSFTLTAICSLIDC